MPAQNGACAPISHNALLKAFHGLPGFGQPFATQQKVQLHDLPPKAMQAVTSHLQDDESAAAALNYIEDERTAAPEWTEEDIVQLHWRLLMELRRLPDPGTPLEEKLDTLAWALTDPDLDDRPFSFASCLRVVGTSPLSPTAHFGAVSVDDIRDWIKANAKRWMQGTLERFPAWVQDLVRQQPDWVACQLQKNPQWINQQIKRRGATRQEDLFGWAGAKAA